MADAPPKKLTQNMSQILTGRKLGALVNGF
jgi:hypothetical protein